MSKKTGRRRFLQRAGLSAAGLMAIAQPLSAANPQQRPQPSPAKTAGARFRELLQKGEPFANVAAYDVFTARMVEFMGFPSLFLGGSLVADFYAEPGGLASLGERVEYARQIAENVDIPAMADIDEGGDPLIIYRVTRQYEKAGVGALHILDSGGTPALLPTSRMVDKIHAALDARSDMVITVRCTAANAEGKDKAIERGVAYTAAGAETIWFTGMTFDDLPRVANAIKIPVTAQMGSDTTMAAAKAARVTVAVYASLLQNIAQSAVYDALVELKETGVMVKAAHGIRLGGRIPADVRNRLIKTPEVNERRTKYNMG